MSSQTGNYLFTSESVSEGHPDKVCDQISDAVLDAFLANDRKLGIADDTLANSRVACETLTTTQKIVVAGEVRGADPLINNGVINREMIADVARGVVRDIGYDQDGFSWHGADVEVLLHGQSADIAQGVNAKKGKGNQGDQEGAGDQGLMFGYACRETEVYEKNSYMPAPIYFSHRILRDLAEARHAGKLPDLLPDTKSQVTVKYVDGKPVGCTKVVVSTQHRDKNKRGKQYTSNMIKEMIRPYVEKSLPKGWMPKKASDFLVNPTGRFVVGGPDGDCGLTGRKIIVDTYGGYAPHGGGAFSGKDLSKVDRSAAYATRYLAKNIVAAGPRRPLPNSGGIRHRRRRPDVGADRLPGHRPRGREETRQGAAGHLQPAADGDPPQPGPEQTDLPAHRRLRPLRPQAGARRRLLLGEDRPGARAEERLQPVGSCARRSREGGEMTDREPENQQHRRKLHGRRQGRPLRPGRARLMAELLPAIDVQLPEEGALDPAGLFGEGAADVWLEIGFGGGEHLAEIAAANPDVGMIGCEFFVDGVASMLRHVEERSLVNVRIHQGDARLLVERLADASLGRVFLLHPDPWPKRRHAARRFIQAGTLSELARVIRPGGELRIATDDPVYLEWTLRHMPGSPFRWQAAAADDWRIRPDDWPGTRYEQKALKAGRRCTYLRYSRAIGSAAPAAKYLAFRPDMTIFPRNISR